MPIFPIILKNTQRHEVAIIHRTKVEFFKLEKVFQINDPFAELEMDLGSGYRKIKQSDMPTEQ